MNKNNIKAIFNRIFNKNKEESKLTGIVKGAIIHMNDHVNLVHDACKICYNKDNKDTYENKAKYIATRLKSGHESILEHSNIVMLLEFSKDMSEDLVEVLDVCRYLETKYKEKDGIGYLLIGGSIRAYKHIFREIQNAENKISREILNLLYGTSSCYFIDFIEAGIMDQRKFPLDTEPDDWILNEGELQSKISIEPSERELGITQRFEPLIRDSYNILNADPLYKIRDVIPDIFTKRDILSMCSITILIKDVSRIISQQLTRHRVGITQLSQRYVDYSSGEFKFNSPGKFKPEKYDNTKKYKISFDIPGTSAKSYKMFTLQELGDIMMNIYPQLTENKALLKEDARAYLPNNSTTSLYMTFTFKSFIKFLELRTDSAAQAEVRILALSLRDDFINISEMPIKEMISYLEPVYYNIQNPEEESVDEVLEEYTIEEDM